MLGLGLSVPEVAMRGGRDRPSLYLNADTIAQQTTFTRTSPASYHDSTGILQTAASGVARVGYRYTGSAWVLAGLVLEPQRTNLLLRSGNMVTGWAVQSGTSATSQSSVLAPDGSTNAALVEDTSTTQMGGVSQSFSITSGSSIYTMSVYVKAGTSSFNSVRVNLSGGTTGVIAELVINSATGAAQWRSGSVGTAFGVSPVGNGWYRVWLSVTDNASGHTTMLTEYRPAFAASYSATLDLTAVGSAYFWGCQAEVGTYPTSYIATTTMQVTRAADVLSKSLGGEFNQNSQTALFKIRVPMIPNTPNFLSAWLWMSAANNHLTLRGTSGGNLSLIAMVNGVQTTLINGPVLAPDTDYKVAVGFDIVSATARLCVNGTIYSQSNFAVPTGLTARYVGCRYDGINQIGIIQPSLPHPSNPAANATEFTRLLSAAEMQGYTT